MTVSEIITVDKDILGGIPVFKNTCVPLQNLFDYLEAGDSLDDFLEDFDYIPRVNCIEILKASEKLLEKSMHENLN
jgi:uncharacterized protein (DUF433 family)